MEISGSTVSPAAAKEEVTQVWAAGPQSYINENKWQELILSKCFVKT